MPTRQLADFGLGQFSKRKHSPAELLLREAEQKVGLVLGSVCGPLQQPASGAVIEFHLRVVSRGQLLRTDLLGEDERHQVLVEWNDTTRAVPDLPLPALLEAQVERTPNATAVIFENASLTYYELNQRANVVAHALIARGIGPEDIVAVVLPRSLEIIVGILGILKSGAA